MTAVRVTAVRGDDGGVRCAAPSPIMESRPRRTPAMPARLREASNVPKRKGQEVKAEDGRGKKKRDEPPPATGDDFEGYVSDTMIEAARNGNIVDLRAILDAGIDVDSQDADSKLTPLMAAAEQGHESCLRLLLQRSAAVDKVDKDGWSALMFAAKEDRGAAVKLLVSKHGKADTELQCQEYGMTACLLACENVSPFL